MTTFHNPYHFVPAKRGQRCGDLVREDFEKNPGHVTHDRYHDGTYSGRLICRLITEKPIFVGASREPGSEGVPARSEHFELDGKPAIPATTIRGLISSVAEAASNSALRVLENEHYSYRKTMRPGTPERFKGMSAIGMVFVERDAEGKEQYLLRPLTLPTLELRQPGANWELASNYRKLFPTPNLKVYIGDEGRIRNPSFSFQTYIQKTPRYFGFKLQHRAWNTDGTLSPEPNLYIKNNRFLLSQKTLNGGDPIPYEDIPEHEKAQYTRGILRVLGCSGREDIPKTKKHELFIPYPEEAESWPKFPILGEAVARFHELSDQRTKARKRGALLPYEPKGTIRNSEPDDEEDNNFRLKTGDMVFFRPSNDGTTIAEISLSSIWRGRVETELRNGQLRTDTAHVFFGEIDKELLPFNPTREKITIAEQLFGFVETDLKKEASGVALAGRVYPSHARLHGFKNNGGFTGEPDDPYLDPVTLKILDSPKLPCPSLYFKSAGKQPEYISKTELGAGKHHPQGRKFYLHRSSRDGHAPWKTADASERSEQKTTVRPVKANAVFYFHFDFDNLSPLELGLLLYALRPAPQFRHKIGMGKSLGLGSVKIEIAGLFPIDRSKRYSGDGLFAERYSEAWIPPAEDRASWPSQYKREIVCQATNPGIEKIAGLREKFAETMDEDIRVALELIGDPGKLHAHVHTPLIASQPVDCEDETFRWFVVNDLGTGNRDAREECLKPLDRSMLKMPVLTRHE